MRGFYLITGCLCLVLTACGVHPAERNNTGNQYIAQGEYDRALQAYYDAQTAEPDNPIVFYNSADALKGLNNLEAAQNALNAAIANGDPIITARAYYNLGNLHFAEENYTAAITAYRESLLLVPENDDARYNLELAMQLLNQATPTAMEMQTDPDDQQANPSVTPTPNPAGDPANPTASPTPTPSPTPPDDLPPPGPSPRYEGTEEAGAEDNNTPTPGPDSENAQEDIENAEEIMEFVESEQQNLPDYRQRSTPGAQPTVVLDRDW